MRTQNNLPSRFSFTPVVALALAFAICLPSAIRAQEHQVGKDGMPPGRMPGMNMKGAQPSMNMTQIKTQAEAEALQPGDSMSMTCGKCKSVMVMPVTSGKEHVKMMTIGEKTTCAECGGTVEVIGTGKGVGKNEEVKHVCSKCGDDAMFCSATKPGSGAMPPMKMN